MVRQPEVLALIPARGGSKGIPRKNIREFAGFPLIAYSIAAGLEAETVTRVIVSTDDAEIAEVARKHGAEVPFIRPAQYAEDSALDLPVFHHALDWLDKEEKYHPGVVVQLRPTSPIRPPGLVDEAVHLLLSHPGVDSVRGVVPAGQNPHKMWRVDPETSLMKPLLEVEGIPEPYNAPRQVLPQVYWQTGHIDVVHSRVILEQNSMSGRKILPVFIDPRYTVDIDTLNDWQRYEHLVYNSGLPMVSPLKRRPLPANIRLAVFDFDGVFTDNRVWVDENGHEMVAANRGDGMGLFRIKKAGIKVLVLSTESNPVVTARCRKLKVEVIQGVEKKGDVLQKFLEQEGISRDEVVYLGNDVNDLECFNLVGCAMVVADAHPVVKNKADLVLTKPGGKGAIREMCDMIIDKYNPDTPW